jgi:hypothetical protein
MTTGDGGGERGEGERGDQKAGGRQREREGGRECTW